jgi:hypothetical protein
MRIRLGIAALVATLWSTAARSHDLRCEKRLDQQQIVHVFSYPASLGVDVTIFNVHPTDVSVVTGIQDFPFDTAPVTVNLPIDVGGSTGGSFTRTIESYDQCVELATAQGHAPAFAGLPAVLDTYTRAIASDSMEAQCTARLVCHVAEPAAACTQSFTPATVFEYPASVRFEAFFSQIGDEPTLVLGAQAPLVSAASNLGPGIWSPEPPLTLGSAQSLVFPVTSYEACAQLPGASVAFDGTVTIPSVVSFTFGSSDARGPVHSGSCSARLACLPPPPPAL